MTDYRLNEHQAETLIRALQVLVLDPRILAYLRRTDPKALAQARDALRQAGAPATAGAVRQQQAAPARSVSAFIAECDAADRREREQSPPATAGEQTALRVVLPPADEPE
jgi:hypothetical protein